MDYKLLRQKAEYIINGLECMQDPQANNEFIALLDKFAISMKQKCEAMIAQQKYRMN